MIYQDNYFVVSVNINFCLRQTKCIDDQDKFQSVKDIDNEFTECQAPRKKLQSIGISPASLHAFMKTFRTDISEAWKVQVDCLNNSEPDSYDKSDMQKKMNVLVRLYEAMQEKWKTASFSEPVQIYTLVPDQWSRMFCSEYFNILEYFVWTLHEIKKVGEILAKHAPEKRKSYHHWNSSSSNKRFWHCHLQFQQVNAWKERLC